MFARWTGTDGNTSPGGSTRSHSCTVLPPVLSGSKHIIAVVSLYSIIAVALKKAFIPTGIPKPQISHLEIILNLKNVKVYIMEMVVYGIRFLILHNDLADR